MFAVAASSREASEAAEHVSEGEAGGESVHGAQRRHAFPSHVPGSHQQRSDQAARKHSARLQRIQTENLPPVACVGVPLIDDQQNLRSKNASQNHEDSMVQAI